MEGKSRQMTEKEMKDCPARPHRCLLIVAVEERTEFRARFSFSAISHFADYLSNLEITWGLPLSNF